MKDKIQIIREEVARIQLYSQSEVLKQVLNYIDKVQEEPVSVWNDASKKYPLAGKEIIVLRENKIYYGKYIGGFHRYVSAEIQLTDDTAQTYAIIDYLTKKDKWIYVEDLLNLSNVQITVKNWKEPVSEIDFEQELYKAFGHVKDFTLGMRIAKWFYNMGRNHQEPVSEDLEEVSKEWLRPQLDKSYANYGEVKMMELTRFDGYAMLDAIEFGAKWQKENLWKSADGDDLKDET